MSIFSRLLSATAASLALGAALDPVSASAAESAAKPNVLFIAVDDLKPMLGCYGDAAVKSPNIDRLAATGTLFLNNQCQQAVCGPSRASLMTGRLPDYTKVYDLKTKMRDMNPDILSLPQHFRQNGYETAGVGKIYDPRCVDGQKDGPSWSIPYLEATPSRENEKGFINPETMAMLRKTKDAEGNPLPTDKRPRRPPTEGSEDVPDNAYDDGATAEVAVDWIAKLAKEDKPYFFAVGFLKPHLPFNAPKKYWDLYDRSQFEVASYTQAPKGTPEFTLQPGWELRSGYAAPQKGQLPEEMQLELIHGYHACVSYTDAQIGKLLDAVEASGEADRTIIVLWGDHGWHLGDHAMWCKHSNYEQATRAPLIFAAPGQKTKGGKVAAPSEFTDIFPTLCELAALPVPEDLDGVSLVRALDDPSVELRKVAQSQFGRHLAGKKLEGYTYRSGRYRYTQWKQMDVQKGQRDGELVARELYDYQTDPLETRNLIDDPEYKEVVGQMEELAASRAQKEK